MIWLELYWIFFQVGVLGIGGGYAAIPLIQSLVVEGVGWLTPEQFADLLAIDEFTPGPIAINSATFVGMQVEGFAGALMATFGFVSPSILIVSVLTAVYRRYRNLAVMQSVMGVLRPAVAATVSAAGLMLVILAFYGTAGFATDLRKINFIAVAIFGVGLFVLRRFKPSPIWVILGAGLLGGLVYTFVPM